jgi:hypothetical protein
MKVHIQGSASSQLHRIGTAIRIWICSYRTGSVIPYDSYSDCYSDVDTTINGTRHVKHEYCDRISRYFIRPGRAHNQAFGDEDVSTVTKDMYENASGKYFHEETAPVIDHRSSKASPSNVSSNHGSPSLSIGSYTPSSFSHHFRASAST